MKRRLVISLVLGLSAVLSFAAVASAHGERSQEGFLRMQTIAFFDVTYEPIDGVRQGDDIVLKQGQDLRLKGKAKVLESWPNNLGQPEVGYIHLSAAGPVMLLKDRLINGEGAPHSIYIHKGEVYEFEMVIEGRVPGRWHLHPTFAVEGAGTLIGPGQWVAVEAAPNYSNPLTLLNGTTIDLENYGLGQVVVWHWLGFFIGLAWMVYWTVPKPTVTRAAVTLQIPLNTDGQEYGLITKRDHRIMNIFALVTVVLLAGGLIWQNAAYPTKIPIQVVRFEPPALNLPARFVEANATRAGYNQDTRTVTIDVTAKNTGSQPVTLKTFTTSSHTFMAGQGMQVEPAATLNPGETKNLKLTIQNNLWEDELLIKLGQPFLTVAGMLTFEDSGGKRNYADILSMLRPERF